MSEGIGEGVARGQLVAAALAARERAYAPYSGYAVGAALRTADGALVGGCNVENALYGATVCAERVALWRAVAEGRGTPVALAVATPGGGTPCGFCRQVLAEHAGPELPILVVDADRPEAPPRALTLGELLPHAWTRDQLAHGADASGARTPGEP